MNNRILLVAAVAGLAIIIGIVGFSGQLIINDVSEGGIIQMSEHGSTGVKPLIMDLEELDISYVDEKFATLNLRFTIKPQLPVILQFELRNMLAHEDTIAGGYDLMDIVALKVIERSRIKTRILKADTAILERVIKGGSGGTEIIHSKKKRAR